MTENQDREKASRFNALQALRSWGESSVPPTVLATLITAQHLQPFQPLPMLFPPVFIFTSYMNINGFQKDSAGISAAWSGLYMLLASRRRQALTAKFTTRGAHTHLGEEAEKRQIENQKRKIDQRHPRFFDLSRK